MKINIRTTIQNTLDNFKLGLIEFDTQIEPSNSDIKDLIAVEVKHVFESLKLEDVNKISAIASARLAYKKCGKDPNRYRPSADSLNRRVVKGNGLYYVNNCVDLLNLVSLKTGFSIGSYDVSKISGEICFDTGTKEDKYEGIGRGLLNIENLPVLRDDKSAFGSPTSDSLRTCISEETKKIVFVFFDFDSSENLQSILLETQKLLEKYTNAQNFKVKTL